MISALCLTKIIRKPSDVEDEAVTESPSEANSNQVETKRIFKMKTFNEEHFVTFIQYFSFNATFSVKEAK